MVRQASGAGVDALNLSVCEAIDAETVQTIKAARLKVYVWTCDRPTIARKMLEAGVDALTTNRPLWLRRQVQRH